MSNKKRIAIIGAGFGGLRLAQDLRKSDYDIWLFDKHNYHQFQPLMYQVASARLEPASISFPLRKVFQYCKNVHIRITSVTSVNPETKTVHTEIGDYPYDYLVLAQGCNTNYFGNKQLEKYAFPMKSVPEAMQLRNRILETFEQALITPPDQLQSLLNFVIVGGGPTGVELAGALAEMKKNILPKDYPDQDFSKLTVYLLEGLPNLLNAMSADSKRMSRKYLEDLGVVVKTDTIVDNYDGETVTLKSGEMIKAKNVIWAAGIAGVQIPGIPTENYTRGNRLIVNRYSELEKLKDVYAVGDISYMETNKYPKGHPQLAAVAIEQATVLAKNFIRMSNATTLKPYEYHDKGSMATVGKRKAVVDLPQFSFQGRLAWFTWMFVHLMLILSVKNKISIFVNWMYSYFSKDSTLRVLLKAADKEVENSVGDRIEANNAS
ncbi:NAD(P)/FAD-dependent oxidoreductase [Flavobacterium sp. MAH-1]|uniref:NADH:ubiquinone reductase (non-electrogenic) n=1 Tax=Flavobacterium agri TaxID=2743471 RepID=A0A7Y8Y501_9FLAO|nr:NAD(P)/FAD-dependent oxidoreductase [Flavobacterium agri]NUY82603.1 NAD(P)/FAD-dependent oxidoreductase [Flavobacterium agri]NYA72626.1 NAD(P)/FAD-dependent oxidoreductase [Flavobacterium agri]